MGGWGGGGGGGEKGDGKAVPAAHISTTTEHNGMKLGGLTENLRDGPLEK